MPSPPAPVIRPAKIEISQHPVRPGAYLLHAEQWLPESIGRVFDFFADARNLESLTPDWLRFHVQTPEPIELRSGALIDYRLRVHGFPLRWRSEIAEWEPPVRFVDRQVQGPYRFWHHEHRFEPRAGGTRVTDEVTYAVPGGALVHSLLVKRDLQKIFAFRQKKLAELFPAANAG